MNICGLRTVSFLLLVCDRGAYCQFNRIHRCSEYINRTVTVHAITSTSSAYVVENTEIIKEQKDVYRR